MLPGPGPQTRPRCGSGREEITTYGTAATSSSGGLAEAHDVEATDVEMPRTASGVVSTDSESETVSSSLEVMDPMEMLEAAQALVDQTVRNRWQCELCFTHHSHSETPWRPGDESCTHSFCRSCLLGCIRWGGRCPYDNIPIPPIVVCGVMGMGEYIYHEKAARVKREGCIACTNPHCPGVAPSTGHQVQPSPCQCCKSNYCGRRICGVPWSVGHRCWDILQQEAEDRDRREALELGDANMLLTGLELRTLNIRRKLAKGPRIRPCLCGAMIEHDGGCNMVYHESCQTRWCFICRRVGTCADFDCRNVSNTVASSSASPSEPPTPLLTPRRLAPIVSSRRKSGHFNMALLPFGCLCLLILLVFAYIGSGGCCAPWFRFGGLPGASFLSNPGIISDMCQTPDCEIPEEMTVQVVRSDFPEPSAVVEEVSIVSVDAL